MWVVVKFIKANDVSAVLFSWIKTDEKTGETLCFWPRKNAEKKRSKPNEPLDTSDGTFYPCKILMDGAKFQTLKKAIQMEIRAQEHSSAETTSNDESVPKKRKRTPKRISSSEESSAKKKRKPAKKDVSSDDASDSSDGSDEPEEATPYVFKKSRTIRLRECYKNLDQVATVSAVGKSDAKHVTVLDVVTVVAAKDSHDSSSSELENVNELAVHYSTTYDKTNDSIILPMDFGSLPYDSIMGDGVPNVNAFEEFDSNPNSNVPKIGDIIELPNENDTKVVTGDTRDATDTSLVQSLFKEISKLNNKIDGLVKCQEGFNTVVVDLAYKILRLEEKLELKNTQQLTLSQELCIPMISEESFTLNETALTAKKTTSENLVSYICSVNFQSELEQFIKTTFGTLFDLDFFYKKVIWKTEPKRINIKETEVMKCIVQSIKGRFPGLKMKADELDDVIYTAGKKLKDAYRKRPKPKDQGSQIITEHRAI